MSITLGRQKLTLQIHTNSCSLRANKQSTLNERMFNRSWCCRRTISVHSHETEPRREMEVWDRAKTRRTSVETEPRPRHERLCLGTSLCKTRVTAFALVVLIIDRSSQFWCDEARSNLEYYSYRIYFITTPVLCTHYTEWDAQTVHVT